MTIFLLELNELFQNFQSSENFAAYTTSSLEISIFWIFLYTKSKLNLSSLQT